MTEPLWPDDPDDLFEDGGSQLKSDSASVVPSPWVDPTGAPSLADLTESGWQQAGVCGQADPEAWFPPQGTYGRHHRQARVLCAGCPVRRECLAWALWFGERHGIWAGTIEWQRRELRWRLRRGQSLGQVLDAVLDADSAGSGHEVTGEAA